jgi:hypothetical protein
MLPKTENTAAIVNPLVSHRSIDRARSPREPPHPCAPLGLGIEARGAPPRAPTWIFPSPLPHAGEPLSPCPSPPGTLSNYCLMLVSFHGSRRTPSRRLQPLSRRCTPRTLPDLSEPPASLWNPQFLAISSRSSCSGEYRALCRWIKVQLGRRWSTS